MNDKTHQMDPYLEKRLSKYDEWLDKGLISYSSRVIPVSESLMIRPSKSSGLQHPRPYRTVSAGPIIKDAISRWKSVLFLMILPIK